MHGQVRLVSVSVGAWLQETEGRLFGFTGTVGQATDLLVTEKRV